MKRKIALILSVLLTLTCVACSTNEYEEISAGDEETAVNEEPAKNEEDSENMEEIKLPETITSGIYAFYNESTNSYLSYNGNEVTLSSTPVNWTLKQFSQSGFYVYAGDSDLVLDIDNAVISNGTAIKAWNITGCNAQIWNLSGNENGTYTFLSDADHAYCLGFDKGNAVLQIRSIYDSSQEWTAIEAADDSE